MRRVLNIPDNYKIGFSRAARPSSLPWCRWNFMTTGTADYLVTGNFSKKSSGGSAKFGTARIAASSKDKNFTYIPDVKAIDYDPNASYIHICQNNTIFGTKILDVPPGGWHPLGGGYELDDLLRAGGRQQIRRHLLRCAEEHRPRRYGRGHRAGGPQLVRERPGPDLGATPP